MNSDALYTDTHLFRKIRAGDAAAFEEIFHRYNSLLYSHVLNKLDDEAEARDIVQDIFIALWEKRHTIHDTNLAGYLFTAARNKVLNAIKHKKVIARYEEDFRRFTRLSLSATDDKVLQKELETLIEAEVSALPPRMREVFVLSRKGHLTHQEIADRLGISKQTVNDHIKNSLKILRPKFGTLLFIIWMWNS